jgi:hypothetical protein
MRVTGTSTDRSPKRWCVLCYKTGRPAKPESAPPQRSDRPAAALPRDGARALSGNVQLGVVLPRRRWKCRAGS